MNPDQPTSNPAPTDLTHPIESPQPIDCSVTASSQETPLPALITLLEPSDEIHEAVAPTPANEADQPVPTSTVPAAFATPALVPTEAQQLDAPNPATVELLASPTLAVP